MKYKKKYNYLSNQFKLFKLTVPFKDALRYIIFICKLFRMTDNRVSIGISISSTTLSRVIINTKKVKVKIFLDASICEITLSMNNVSAWTSTLGVNFGIEICGESDHPSKHRFFTEVVGGGKKFTKKRDPFKATTGFVITLPGAGRGGKHGGDAGSLGRPAMRLETAMDPVNNLFKRD